jgi:hypothetical protein
VRKKSAVCRSSDASDIWLETLILSLPSGPRQNGTSIANALLGGPSRASGSVERGVRRMSIFDPFDPARMEDGPTCICGRHRSQAEHDYQSRLMLQSAPVEADRQKRFDGVVAAYALRTSFRPRG